MRLHGVVVVEDAPLGGESPRPGRTNAFAEVANRPIAHHVLDVVRAGGAQEIVVVCSEELASGARACLSTWGSGETGLRYVAPRGRVDVAAGMRAAAQILGSAPCIVHLASGLLDEPLAPYVARLRTDAPHAIAFDPSTGPGQRPGQGVTSPPDLRLVEPDPAPVATDTDAVGVWLFGAHALSCVAAGTERPTGVADLTTVAERLHDAGGRLETVSADAWGRYAGDPLDLLDLNRIALDSLPAGLRRPGGAGNRIEGRVWVHEHAAVRDSVIVGPTVIGPDARLTNAYIGPYTSVGAGTHIEGAEVERSIIGPRASILHIGARIMDSVIGQDARLFRDFSLPRALRLRVGDGTEIAFC